MPTTGGSRMSRRARTAGRIGALVALVCRMTGCIKLNMNLGINSDNTVSGTVEFGVQKELLDLTGQNVEDLLGSDAPFPSNSPGVTVEPFDDGEFAGQQFIFEDVPIEEFNSGGFAGASGPTSGAGGGAHEASSSPRAASPGPRARRAWRVRATRCRSHARGTRSWSPESSTCRAVCPA